MVAKTKFRHSLFATWARWRRDERGVSAVEFALIVPVMLVMFLSISDYAVAVYHKIELASATRAGAQYALVDSSTTLDTASILSVVQNSTLLDPANLTVTVNETCSCSNGSSVSCTGTCTTGSVQHFANIAASYTNAWFFLPGGPITLTEQSIVRVQ